MVDQIISKQGLINANKDANTLEECINGPANKKVRSRLGQDYWTLATVGSIVEETKTETNEFMNDLATRYLALSLKGDWQAATAYAVKDLVFVENITYICLVAHTSSSSFQNDLNTGKWFVYQGATQVDLQNYLPKNAEFAPVLGSPVRFRLNPVMASLVYGINDPLHLDDNLNNFRGLNNPNAWHESNIGIGGVAFGRNNPPFAYLSLAFGHDCVGFGVASITGGAGSCTGNPDVPNNGADYGYCSLAIGKDTQARGRISNAFGEGNISESLYSSTDGYNCFAGQSRPEHPNYNPNGTQGAAARAHGYESRAYGNFSFAYGTFLRAYNGAQAIGKGYDSGGTINPMVVDIRGVGIGYNVPKPTIFCKEGDMSGASIGFNTDAPISRYDFRFGASGTQTKVIETTSGSGLLSDEVRGLMGNGSYGVIHSALYSHPNAGTVLGTVEYRINGNLYQSISSNGYVSFNQGINIGGGGLSVAGVRVVGGQLPAIANLPTTATLAEVIARQNEILGVFRLHGLIAT